MTSSKFKTAATRSTVELRVSKKIGFKRQSQCPKISIQCHTQGAYPPFSAANLRFSALKKEFVFFRLKLQLSCSVLTEDEMIEIPLQGPHGVGLRAIIDDEFEHLSQFDWWAWKPKNHIYATRRVISENGHLGPIILMHREITGAPAGQVVDHVNGNTLDNRVENLRICSRGENAKNRGKTKTKMYLGVAKKDRQGRYRAYANKLLAGYFADRRDAAEARDWLVIQLGDRFTRLNFPERLAEIQKNAEWFGSEHAALIAEERLDELLKKRLSTKAEIYLLKEKALFALQQQLSQ